MKGYMYILQCADGSFYTGSTKDLKNRIWEHQTRIGANFTRKKYPVELVYFAVLSGTAFAIAVPVLESVFS